MDLFQIIFLALLQGITEFLPISSSAHLILPSQLLGWEDQGLAFDVAVHAGTLLAVMIYFRHELVRLIKGWLLSVSRQQQTPDGHLAWGLLMATVPAAFAGFMLDDFIEENLRTIVVIATTTAIFGILLQYADWHGRKEVVLTETGWKTALFIGFAQMLALIPGTSRSGITITAGLLAGLTREDAARFSFLLAIPLIAGAGLFKTKDLLETGTQDQLGAALTGAVISAVSAFLIIRWFIGFVSRAGMLPFTLYRLGLAAVLFFIVMTGA